MANITGRPHSYNSMASKDKSFPTLLDDMVPDVTAFCQIKSLLFELFNLIVYPTVAVLLSPLILTIYTLQDKHTPL